MSGWNFGDIYRGRVVNGQVIIKTLPSRGTMLVEAIVEVSHGGKQGQRVPYTGYINSPENCAKTMKDLRSMGWRGTKWNDWTGLNGSKEFQFRLMGDERDGSTFPRVAFPSPLRTVNEKHSSAQVDIDKLNESFEEVLELVEAQAKEGDIPF